MRASWLPVLLLLSACGTDAGTPVDASSDAPVADAGGPDAFDACPGQVTFEAEVLDWGSGDALADVVVEDGTGASSVSAPNGRVLLCVARTGPLQIRLSSPDHLDRLHSTTGERLSTRRPGSLPPSLRLLTPEDADTLYTSAGFVRDEAQMTVIALVRDAATGAGLAGGTVSLDLASAGGVGYTPEPDGTTLSPGSTTGDDGRVLFLNTAADAVGSLSVTGLSNCESPVAIAPEPGAVVSAALTCLP